jgi:nitroimidazol reductase NimA-like FMN-containing flavoprotein (pyridoxamine 5'-phosphate oxidase superfamily)
MANLYYNKTERVTVRRRAGRGSHDRATIDAILDEGIVAHVGLVSEGRPYVLPVLYARAGARLYLHGSPLSRLLGTLAEGAPVCLTVTLVDGIVFARSAFHHSVNYRSVVVLGDARPIRGADEKQAGLRAIVEHVACGRSADARGPNDQELAATEVVALAIREASAKIRTGPPVDAAADLPLPVWAGELPLALAAGEPVPDAGCAEPVPSYVSAYRRGRRVLR